MNKKSHFSEVLILHPYHGHSVSSITLQAMITVTFHSLHHTVKSLVFLQLSDSNMSSLLLSGIHEYVYARLHCNSRTREETGIIQFLSKD